MSYCGGVEAVAEEASAVLMAGEAVREGWMRI